MPTGDNMITAGSRKVQAKNGKREKDA